MPEHTKEQVDTEYQRNMSLPSSIRIADEPLPEFSFPGTAIAGKEKLIRELLAIRFERPELSDRERLLLSLAENQKTQQLLDMKRIFVDDLHHPRPI